jgi:two-component system sensor kinase FixL
MSWVTIIWSTIASVSFTLATIYLLIWFRERRSWAYLCFFVMAAGVIGLATGEMAAMYAKSPAEYGTAVRWSHFAFGFVVLGSLGFVHFYFGTGKGWLLGTALGLRLLAVVANFTTGLNLHIRAIQSLQQMNFLGEPVSMLGEWTPNPWVRLGQFAALAQFVYVVDASLRLWRPGSHESRRRAVLVGGTMAFFILFASAQAGLVAAGVLRMPIIVSFPFLAVLLAMGYELSRDVLRASQLGRELRESEERMTLASEAAGFGVWMWSIPRNQVWGSERWLHLFGFPPGAAVSFEMVMQRIHPDDHERVEREVRRALSDRADYTGEYRVILPDGTQRWIVTRGRMHSDTQGKPGRMMGAAIDITGRKQAELEIVQQRNEVAHLSRVTTLGEISGSLAHELNQPLGAILANTDELHLQSQIPNLARHSRGHSQGRPARRGDHPRDTCLPAAAGVGKAAARSRATGGRSRPADWCRRGVAQDQRRPRNPAWSAARDRRPHPPATSRAQPAGQWHGCREHLPRGEPPYHHPGRAT